MDGLDGRRGGPFNSGRRWSFLAAARLYATRALLPPTDERWRTEVWNGDGRQPNLFCGERRGKNHLVAGFRERRRGRKAGCTVAWPADRRHFARWLRTSNRGERFSSGVLLGRAASRGLAEKNRKRAGPVPGLDAGRQTPLQFRQRKDDRGVRRVVFAVV